MEASILETFPSVTDTITKHWDTPEIADVLDKLKRKIITCNIKREDEMLDDVNFLRSIYVNDKTNIEQYPHILKNLTGLWGCAGATQYLQDLLNYEPSLTRIKREGFSFETLKELQFLYVLSIEQEEIISTDVEPSVQFLERNQVWDYLHANH